MSIFKSVFKSTIFYIFILNLLVLKPLFKTGVWLSSDLIAHIARLASFYQSLAEGNLIPRWGGNLNFGYGHPVLLFSYPLPNYFGSFFHFLGFSFNESVKLVFIFSYLLAGVFTYLWLKDWLGKYPAILGTILYQFAPYRFVNIYVRAALGEHFAFLFIPLVFWSVYKFSQKIKIKYWVYSVFSLAALILSHNGVIVYTLPVLFAYFVFLFFTSSKSKRKKYLTGIIFYFFAGMCLTTFFWVPLLVEAELYTNSLKFFSGNSYCQTYLSFDRLVFSPWGYGGTATRHEPAGHTTMIGFVHWLVSLLALGYLFKWKRKINPYWIFIFLLIIIFFLSLFFMLRISNFLFPLFAFIFRYAEYASRLLTLPILTTFLIGALLTNFLKGRKQRFFVLFLSFWAVILTTSFWQTVPWDKRRDYTDSYWLHYYTGTTDTGGYNPVWGYFSAPSTTKVLANKGEITNINIKKWHSTLHEYSFKAITKARIVESTAYFPGWRVYVDGQKIPINFQEKDFPGTIIYNVSPGEHKVKTIFGPTRLRLGADIVSLITFVLLLILLIFSKKLRWFKNIKHK